MYKNLLIFLCLFHIFGNIIWLNLNKSPFTWDEAGHAIISFKFTDFFNGSNRNQDFLSISDYYPPFVHLLVSFLMLVFGKNILIGPIIITGFFILAIVFLYLYSYELFHDKMAAFFAGSIFSLLPNIYALSRQYLLEIPLVAITLGALYFLEKNFKIFIIFLSLALMTKWTAIIFLFFPIIYKLRWKKSLLALSIAVLVNFPWYFHNLSTILHASQTTATPEVANPQSVFSYDSFKYYLFAATNFQLTLLGMVFFVISVVYFILKKRKQSFFILGTLFFIYISFTLIGNKNIRYIIFLAPIACMLIGYFLSNFRKNLIYLSPSYEIKRESITVATWLIFNYFIFYYFTLSFGMPLNSYAIHLRRSVNIPFFGWIDIINLGRDSSRYLAPTYDPTFWPNGVIVKELSYHNGQKNIKILVVCEKPHLNQVNLELERRGLNLKKIQFLAPYDIPPFSSDEELEKYLTGFDVILLADYDLGPEGGIRAIPARLQISNFLKSEKSNQFRLINTYPLPDEDKLDVYITNEN